MSILKSIVLPVLLLAGCGLFPGKEGLSARGFPATVGQPLVTFAFQGQPEYDCPVTTPQNPEFIPPITNIALNPDQFWFGTTTLWTSIPRLGEWHNLPRNPEGFTQKIFWWSEGYSGTDERLPDLRVRGERLDEPGPALTAARATNAFADDIGLAILTGVDFPTVGCWEITGSYKKATLIFVIEINP